VEDDLHTLHGEPDAGDPQLARIWTDPDRLMPRYRELLRLNWYGGDWLPSCGPTSALHRLRLPRATLSFGPRTTWQQP